MSQQKSFLLQKDIKDNSEELKDFITGLHTWEKDIKEQEEQIPSETKQDLPPVRCRVPEISTKKIVTESKRRKDEDTKKKKERISSYDYAAWDKFDVDKALDSSDEEASLQKIPKTVNAISGENKTVRLSPKERATKLKDEGNKCYSNGELEDAVAKYTQGMALDPTNAILPANRAMAYIKLEEYKAAETDCTRCLKLDANYIKAYLRRGTSRLKLEKLTLAAEDFRKVLELEPWNKDAKKELEKLEIGEKLANHDDSEAQKNLKNADQTVSHNLKETILKNENTKDAREMEKESTDADLQKKSKDMTPVSTDSSSTKGRKELGKKIKIEEVNSSQSQPTSTKAIERNTVLPVDKLPHQRSQKPLKRVKVTDVPSEDSIPKELKLLKMVPKDSLVKKNSGKSKSTKESTVPENVQKSPEKPTASTSLPPIPCTSHQFTQDWQRLAQYKTLAVQYLKAIPPPFLQSVDLETEMLVDLVSALRWDDFTPEQCVSYLSALVQSSGFTVNVMFLDESQKKVFYEVIDKCKDLEHLHQDLFKKMKKSLL